MNDVSIPVADIASDIARIGSVLGRAGVGLEGGGVWSGRAHYLVADGAAAVQALTDAGIEGVFAVPVLVAPLRADIPGELGRMMAALARAGVTIDAQYSDHDNRKVFVVDDLERAREAVA